jgi:1-acyl-sn-glycerol-3-phosphate acyltransferase
MFLYYLRTIAVSLYFFLFCFLAFIICLPRPLHGSNTRYALKMLRPADWLMNLRTIPLNQAPHTSPVVYIVNHQDLLDTFFFAKIWPHNCSGVGKRELAYVPIFGLVFWLAGNIYINRADKGKAFQVIDQMADKIVRLQRSIFIMPEGTRSKGKGLLPFKKGAFLTAIKAGVPIVPLCVSSTTNVKLDQWAPKPTLMEFLEPIPTTGLTADDADELATRCHELMKAKIAQLDQRLAAEY